MLVVCWQASRFQPRCRFFFCIAKQAQRNAVMKHFLSVPNTHDVFVSYSRGAGLVVLELAHPTTTAGGRFPAADSAPTGDSSCRPEIPLSRARRPSSLHTLSTASSLGQLDDTFKGGLASGTSAPQNASDVNTNRLLRWKAPAAPHYVDAANGLPTSPALIPQRQQQPSPADLALLLPGRRTLSAASVEDHNATWRSATPPHAVGTSCRQQHVRPSGASAHATPQKTSPLPMASPQSSANTTRSFATHHLMGQQQSAFAPIPRAAAQLPPEVEVTCLSPSVPLGSDVCDVLIAVGTSKGHLLIVHPTASQITSQRHQGLGHIVAVCAPPHVSQNCVASSTQEPPNTSAAAAAWSCCGGMLAPESLDGDDACRTVTWIRGRGLICAGYQSGRVSWFTVAGANVRRGDSILSSPVSADTSSYHPSRLQNSSRSNVDGSPGVVKRDIALRHVVTFPSYASNTFSPILSSHMLYGADIVVVGTSSEIFLFDTAPQQNTPTVPQPSTSAQVDGSWLDAPHGAPLGQLARPFATIARSAEYIACHNYLPFFAVLSRGPLPPVNASGALQSTAFASLSTFNASATPTPPSLGSPHLPPSAPMSGAHGGGLAPLHLQVFEFWNGVASACGPARLVRQNCRSDAVLDAVWRYSTELMLIVNTSEDSNLRLYKFSSTSIPSVPGGVSALALASAGAAASLHYDTNIPNSVASQGPRSTGVAMRWMERTLCFPSSHAAVINIEWVSAGSALFRQVHDGTSARISGGHSAAPGLGEMSHVVGFNSRGELCIVTVHSDPVVSWLDNSTVIVASGPSVCTLPTNDVASGTSIRDLVAGVTTRSSTKTFQHDVLLSLFGGKSRGMRPHNAIAVNPAADVGGSSGVLHAVTVDVVMELRALLANFSLDAKRNAEQLTALLSASLEMHLSPSHRRSTRHGESDTATTMSSKSFASLPRGGAVDDHSLFLVLLWRYIAALEAFNVCQASGPVPGILQLITLPEHCVPTNSQLAERGVILASASPQQQPHTTSSWSSNGAVVDPRRVLLLHVFDWLPKAPDRPGSAARAKDDTPLPGVLFEFAHAAESSNFVVGVSPWLTDKESVERLAAQLIFFQRLEDAAAVLQLHEQVHCVFAPLAAVLHSWILLTQAAAAAGDGVAQRQQSLRAIQKMCSCVGPLLSSALRDVVLMSASETAVAQSMSNVPSNSSSVFPVFPSEPANRSSPAYEDAQLCVTDRLMIALIRIPDHRALSDVLRSVFLVATCNTFLRLLLDGIREETVSAMQWYIDATSDVQVATCLFARLGVAGGTAPGFPQQSTGGSFPTTNRGVQSATIAAPCISHLLWPQWCKTYRAFLNDRGLFVQRTLLDIQLRGLEAVVSRRSRVVGGVVMAIPSSEDIGTLPLSTRCGLTDAAVAGFLMLSPATGAPVPLDACVCSAPDARHLHIPRSASNVTAILRVCVVCRAHMRAPMMGESQHLSSCAATRSLQSPPSPSRDAASGKRPGLRASTSYEHMPISDGEESSGVHPESRSAAAPTKESVLPSLRTDGFVWCSGCGHGGHAAHMEGWFAIHKRCPVEQCSCMCGL